MGAEICTSNDQLVCRTGDGSIKLLAPKPLMTRDEALRTAAWLVAITLAEDGEFAAILAAVRRT